MYVTHAQTEIPRKILNIILFIGKETHAFVFMHTEQFNLAIKYASNGSGDYNGYKVGERILLSGNAKQPKS